MPKSQKARKQARFNPLAAARRAAEGQEEPGTSAAAAEEAPKLSAHQLRHIERKRLQVCRPRRDPARHHERSSPRVPPTGRDCGAAQLQAQGEQGGQGAAQARQEGACAGAQAGVSGGWEEGSRAHALYRRRRLSHRPRVRLSRRLSQPPPPLASSQVRQQAKTLRRAPKGGGGGGGGAGEAVEAVGEGAADDTSIIDAPMEADEPLRGFRCAYRSRSLCPSAAPSGTFPRAFRREHAVAAPLRGASQTRARRPSRSVCAAATLFAAASDAGPPAFLPAASTCRRRCRWQGDNPGDDNLDGGRRIARRRVVPPPARAVSCPDSRPPQVPLCPPLLPLGPSGSPTAMFLASTVGAWPRA